MSETTNYKLHLTDSDSERFLDWREKMNGTTDSNMIKIDTALGEKADNSVFVATTLFSDLWTGTHAPYTQELYIEGLTSAQNGVIGISHDATSEQKETAGRAALSVIGQEENKLIIISEGEIPEVDIPVTIILLD